jgi:uncharacterized membrane protein HdeD (DUF308 family)
VTTAPVSPLPAGKRAGAQVNWIVLLVAGILAALLGIFLLFMSNTAALVVIQVIGIYWLVAGLVELFGLLGDRGAPMRLARLIGAICAIASGGLILFSMLVGQVILPGVLRIVLAFTALILGVVNLVVGSSREAPARGRQLLGVVYALLGVALFVDPAALPTIVFPLIGLLLAAAGGYAIYLAVKGREAGSVALGIPGVQASPAVQKQAMLDQAQKDVDEIAKQAKGTSLGPKDGS